MTPDPTTDPSRTSAHGHTPGDGDSPPTVVGAVRAGHPRGFPDVPGFAVTAEIARGGMGVVYAGRELALDREVAIKTLLPGSNPDRFVTESRITGRLSHPNIPPVYTFGQLADGVPFLAMKYVRGRTLADHLTARPSPDADLPRWVQVFEQIAHAVGFAHASDVIHRDLKPANVMVGSFNEVQVMDWGLARGVQSAERKVQSEGTETADDSTPQDGLTRAGQVMGTPAFMAPEQARGEAVDARADVFALGAILAVILTGKPAFVADTVGRTVDKAARADLADTFERLDRCTADAELIDIARRCLAADPADRPEDGQDVAEAVADYRASVEARLRDAETARAVSAADAESARKRRTLATVAVAMLLAVFAAGAVVSLIQAGRARDAETEERTQRQAAETATSKALGAERKATEREAKEREAREHAERQQKIADRSRKFLIDYFAGRATWIGGAVVGGPSGPDVTLREVIAFAEEHVGKGFGDLPEAEFELRLTFASLQHMLGTPAGYERHIGRARELAKQLGLENSTVLRTIEAQTEMHSAFRRGNLMSGGLAGLVSGSKPSAPGNAESAAMNAHLLKGALAFQARDFPAAEAEFRAAVTIAEKYQGPTGPSALTTRLLLATILAAAEQTDKAQAEFDLVTARGRTVEWGRMPVALAGAYSHALKAAAAKDDAAVLALAPGLEQAARDFEQLGLWDTEHGALLVGGLARLRQVQKRPAEAAEMFARLYRTVDTNPFLPRCEIAYRAALIHMELNPPATSEAHFYISVAMAHPAWPTMPADVRETGPLIRGITGFALGRYKEAEADMRPELPARMRGTPVQKFTVATLGAALDNREYLKPFLDAVPALSALNPQAAAQTAGNVLRLAQVAERERNFALAIELYTTGLDLARPHFAPDVLAEQFRRRGHCHAALARHAEAAADFRTALAALRRAFGDAGLQTRGTADDLATALGLAGDRAGEIALRKQTFEATRRALGDSPAEAWEDAARLLTACAAAGEHSAIDPTAKTPVAALAALSGGDAGVQQRIAAAVRPRKAAAELLATVATARADARGELDLDTVGAVAALLDACREAGDVTPSVAVLTRVVTRAEKEGFKHPRAGEWVDELAAALEATHRDGPAEEWRRKWLAAAEAGGRGTGTTALARALLGRNLLRQKRWADAEPLLHAAQEWFAKNTPDEWFTFHVRSLYGAALLGLQDTGAAEPLLTSGYEGVKARAAKIPAVGRDRLPEAVDWLVALAVAKGDKDGEKRWKAERARYREVAPMPRPR